MTDIASAIENYKIDRLEHGSLHWRVSGEYRETLLSISQHDGAAFVEAHSNTGYRYIVVVTPLTVEQSASLGADRLVTVVQPWQAAYPAGPTGYLTMDYVAKKWGSDQMSTVDLYMITRTIALALGVRDDVEMGVMEEGGADGDG